MAAYVGTYQGMYRWLEDRPTHDSWTEYNSGLPLVDIKDLLVDPSFKELRAATWSRGVWNVVPGPDPQRDGAPARVAGHVGTALRITQRASGCVAD